MKRKIVAFIIRILRAFFSIFYDKRYLHGKMFSDDHFSKGWRSINRIFFTQKILGWNRQIPWPCAPHIIIGDYTNIVFHVDDIDNFFSSGNYFQGIGAILTIGRGTTIAPGVGLITANHDINDITKNVEGKPVTIGENCWIGMNAVILPGVELGDNTVVGAGAIVTKSFIDGHCVIVGNPAKKVKDILIGGK